MIKSLLLNSALLEMKNLALAFHCSYASSVINQILNPLKNCGIRLHSRIPLTNFADSTHICGFHLQLRNPEQLAIIACCGILGRANVLTKFMLQVFVRAIHVNFVSGIHLNFGACFKVCLWNPGSYKIERLSSASFGLIMKVLIIHGAKLWNYNWFAESTKRRGIHWNACYIRFLRNPQRIE